jgi:hypothetical protein
MSHETGKICLYCRHWVLLAIHDMHGDCKKLPRYSGEMEGLFFYGSGEEFLTGPHFGCIHWESDSQGQEGGQNEEE